MRLISLVLWILPRVVVPSCSPLLGQCGGIGWEGPSCCDQGSCFSRNSSYSQCILALLREPSDIQDAADDGSGLGVAAADLDNDGDVDLLVSRYDVPNILLRNDGNFLFTDVTAMSGLEDIDYSIGASIGDIDGDGLADIYISTFGDYNKLLKNTGGMTFEDVASTPSFNVASGRAPDYGGGVALIDFDGDGDLDIFAASCQSGGTIGKNHLFENLGTGFDFREVTESSGADDELGCAKGIAVADLDDDGDCDVVVTNEERPDLFLENRGGLRFVERSWAAEWAGNSSGRGVAIADVNLDGLPDVYISNSNMEPNIMLENQGDFVFARRSGVYDDQARFRLFVLGMTARHISLVQGFVDLYLANNGQQDRLWINNQSNHFSFAAVTDGFVTAPEDSHGIAFADFDQDGDQDVYVVNFGQSNRLFENLVIGNEAFEASWLAVQAFDHAQRVTLQGSAVRILLAGTRNLRGLRTIDGGSGYCSQNAYDVHFGLPAVSNNTYDVEVRLAGTSRWLSKSEIPEFGGAVPNTYIQVNLPCIPGKQLLGEASFCPSMAPTVPSFAPSLRPTPSPTSPTTVQPSFRPTKAPSTSNPSSAPTAIVTTSMPSSTSPTNAPTASPSGSPSTMPSVHPSMNPSIAPTSAPMTYMPTARPSESPSTTPTVRPSIRPSRSPSTSPTTRPSDEPTSLSPTVSPTVLPSTSSPSSYPSVAPSQLNGIDMEGDYMAGTIGTGGEVTLRAILDRYGALASAGAVIKLKSSADFRVRCSLEKAWAPTEEATTRDRDAPQLLLANSAMVEVTSASHVMLELSLADVSQMRSDGSLAGTAQCAVPVEINDAVLIDDRAMTFARAEVRFPTIGVPAFIGLSRGAFVSYDAMTDAIALSAEAEEIVGQVVINGKTNLTLFADANTAFLIPSNDNKPGAFSTRVMVGGFECRILGVTPRMLSFETPSFSEACQQQTVSEDGGQQCGERTLRVANVGTVDGTVSEFEATCEGCIVYARECIVTDGFSPRANCSAAAEAFDSQSWDDLTCPFGEADDCSVCPREAVFCPGGFIMRPREGYWVDIEQRRPEMRIVACAQPASKRCPGAAVSRRADGCGDAYRGFACQRCAEGYWSRNTESACEACPPDPTAAKIRALAMILGLLCGTFLFVFAAIFVVRQGDPGAVQVAFWRSVEFVGWCAATSQLLASAVKDIPSDSQPPVARHMFDFLQLTLLDFSRAIHPDCSLESDPTLFVVAHLSAVLALSFSTVIFVIALLRRVHKLETSLLERRAEESIIIEFRRTRIQNIASIRGSEGQRINADNIMTAQDVCDQSSGTDMPNSNGLSEKEIAETARLKRLARLSRLMQGLVLLSYPRTCETTLAVLHCRHPGIVWASPEERARACFEGENAVVYILAVIVAISVVIALPLTMFMYIVSRRETLARMTEPPTSLRPYILGKYLLSDFRFMVTETVFKKLSSKSGGSESSDDQCGDGQQGKKLQTETQNGERLFWFKFVYLGQFLVLALVRESGKRDDQIDGSNMNSVGHIVAIVGVLTVYGFLLLRFRPYVNRKRWKHPVRLFSLFVVSSVTVLTYVQLNRLSEGRKEDVTMIAVIGWIIFLLAALLLLVLFGAFGAFIYEHLRITRGELLANAEENIERALLQQVPVTRRNDGEEENGVPVTRREGVEEENGVAKYQDKDDIRFSHNPLRLAQHQNHTVLVSSSRREDRLGNSKFTENIVASRDGVETELVRISRHLGVSRNRNMLFKESQQEVQCEL